MIIRKNAMQVASRPNATILMIEDNEGDIELARLAFKGCNYEMIFLRGALEALDYLRNAATFGHFSFPDLILLDLNMPRMDGKEFLEAIRTDEKMRSIPIILLTSSRAPADIHDCYRLHASGYMVKPSGAAERAAMVKYVTSFLEENRGKS